jgi:ATP-dependent Clp protease protease subunit
MAEAIQAKEPNIIFMFDDFNNESCQRIVKELIKASNDPGNEKKDIKLFINSPGGLVTSLMAIIDTMRIIQKDVETTCVGQAASCGAVLLACGTKGKRYITKNSRVLLHQVSSGTEGHVKDMTISVEEVNRLNELVLDLLCKATGKNIKKIKKDMERDLWLSAEEALKYGIVDKII